MEQQLTKEILLDQISELEYWIAVYKQLGQYHQRYHAENELKRLDKLLVKLNKKSK